MQRSSFTPGMAFNMGGGSSLDPNNHAGISSYGPAMQGEWGDGQHPICHSTFCLPAPLTV